MRDVERLRKASKQMSRVVAYLPESNAKSLLTDAILSVQEAIQEIQESDTLPEAAEYVKTLSNVMMGTENLTVQQASIIDKIMLNIENGVWKPVKEVEDGEGQS